MKQVSFVLPVYKAEKYLKTVLDSIKRQQCESGEVILVDDGSPDGSAFACDMAAMNDPSVISVHKPNAGSGFARNTGLGMASGEYVCFIDPDDYIDDDLVRDNLAVAEKEKSDIVVFGHHIIYENRLGEVDHVEEELPGLEGNFTYAEFIENLYEFWLGNPSTVWGKLFRRDYIEKNGLKFNSQSVGQDAVFCLDVYETPFSLITFVKKPYYEHILREGSAVDRYHDNRYQSELNIAKKLDDMISRFGLMDGPCKNIVAERYMRVLALEGANIVKPESGMTFGQKIAHMRKLGNIDRVKWAISSLNMSFFKNSKSKLATLILLKLRMYALFLTLKKVIQKKTWK